jgi:SM-20-related protein
MHALDLAAFHATPLVRRPFEYLIVPGFIRAEARARIDADYPRIEDPGSFPIQGVTCGPAFRALIDMLEGPAVRAAFAEKFGTDLSDLPTVITVRGQSGPQDGRIHTDIPSKVITALIYMNARCDGTGGRLRLLRSPSNIEDVLVEVPPVEGTLVAFRRSANSYHGHLPCIGPRRVIQLNWVVGRGAKRRAIIKHRVSARWKKIRARFRRAHPSAGSG